MEQWESAHIRWVATWDRIGRHASECGVCGYPDARHRIADAMVGAWIAGDPIEVVADEYGVSLIAAADVVLAGVNAERARLAARVPRGREPPVRAETTSTTSTT